MCLIVFSFQPDSPLPLAVAANRDEFHERPTRPAGFLPENPRILAGKDLRAGGTWLGIDRAGRFAAITNFRDPENTAVAARSRGELVSAYLEGSAAPGEYLRSVGEKGGEYAGFNLLAGNREQLWYLSNCPLPDGSAAGPMRVAPGVHGLSNAHLDTPWPKVTEAVAAFPSSLRTFPPEHSALAATVADRRTADPRKLHLQGLTTEMEQRLSAQFILAGEYGTRSCTTLWLQGDGACHFRELTFDPQGGTTGRRTFAFRADHATRV